MVRKRGVLFLVMTVVVVAGIAGNIYYSSSSTSAAAEAEEPPLQTAVVRQGDLVISATGVGSVVPAAEVSLSFRGSGVLAELLVQVGDRIQAGDVLARLDDSSARQSVANAELQLAQTSLQVDPQARERSVALAQINVDQALINLASVESALAGLLDWAADEDAVAVAQASVDAAQAAYDNAVAKDAAAGSSLTSVSISLDQAQRGLADAEAAYETAFDPGRDWELMMTDPTCQQGQGGALPCTGPSIASRLEGERAGAENAVLRAQENLQIAQANYAVASSSLNDDSALNARTSLLNAEIALKNALTGPADSEIEAAGIKVQQAELALRQAELNLQNAQDTSQAELSRQQAQLNLASAQETLAQTDLTSPMDGTVMAIAAQPGEMVGSGVLITLADLAQPLIEVYLDQTDLDKIGVGFEAEVILDALPDQTFTGRVIQVDPSLTTVQGVSTIRGLVQLAEASFAKPQTLPVGLTAAVDIIGGRATRALLVPVEALRELSPGEYAVFVMDGDEPTLRLVEVGLMDFTFAEITSGLEAGEVVTTGIVETE